MGARTRGLSLGDTWTSHGTHRCCRLSVSSTRFSVPSGTAGWHRVLLRSRGEPRQAAGIRARVSRKSPWCSDQCGHAMVADGTPDTAARLFTGALLRSQRPVGCGRRLGSRQEQEGVESGFRAAVGTRCVQYTALGLYLFFSSIGWGGVAGCCFEYNVAPIPTCLSGARATGPRLV